MMNINVLTDTRCGKMLYNQNDLIIGKSLELYGEWAESECNFLRPYICLGNVCVDAGVNIGTHILFLADLVGAHGEVHSFEMQKIPFQLLCANVALNHHLNVSTYNTALSNWTGNCSVGLVNYSSPYNYGEVSLKCNYDKYYMVHAIELDSLEINKLDFVKLDVEGFESEILTGSINTIKRCHPLIYLEYHPEEQSSPIIPILTSLGYCIYFHLASFFNPLNLKNYRDDFSNGYKEPHLFCVHKSRNLFVNLERIA